MYMFVYLPLPTSAENALCSKVLYRGWTLKSRARVQEWVLEAHTDKYTCPFNIYYGITVYVLRDKRIPCECRRMTRGRGFGLHKQAPYTFSIYFVSSNHKRKARIQCVEIFRMRVCYSGASCKCDCIEKSRKKIFFWYHMPAISIYFFIAYRAKAQRYDNKQAK